MEKIKTLLTDEAKAFIEQNKIDDEKEINEYIESIFSEDRDMSAPIYHYDDEMVYFLIDWDTWEEEYVILLGEMAFYHYGDG